MATVTSLGIHTPTAIPYLVADGVLPPEPAERLFTWQTTTTAEPGDSGFEEELVTTDHQVVWSRCGILQRIFRFDVEKEKIVQAVFASFPSPSNADLVANKSPQGHRNSGWTGEKGATALKTRRPLQSSTKTSGVTIGSRPRSRSSEDQRWNLGLKNNRALVVVLRTQAHVFFLEGTRHVVPLPFEVEAVFPLPYGILLQRKLPLEEAQWGASPSMAQTPFVPPNSFAFSQPSFEDVCATDIPSIGGNAYGYADLTSPFSTLLGRVIDGSTRSRITNLPRLFSLTDPLNELGTTVLAPLDIANGRKRSLPSVLNPLDPKEDTLYLSSHDELAGQDTIGQHSEPLILSVTQHQETRKISIWLVKRLDRNPKSRTGRATVSNQSGTWSRRRSSYGHGAGTGVTTPAARSVGTRESFGKKQLHAYVDKDAVIEHCSTEAPDSLFSQLETAFENPNVPVKSSRRVSSLLARADLSTSFNRTTFSDLVGAAGHPNRRGGSLGADAARLSIGQDVGIGVSRPLPQERSRASNCSRSLLETESEYHDEDSDEDPGQSVIHRLKLRDRVQGLRQEFSFTRLFSAPLEVRNNHLSNNENSTRKIKLFTLKSPHSSIRDDKTTHVFVCVVDTTSRIFFSVQIELQSSTLPQGTAIMNSPPPSNTQLSFHVTRVGSTVRKEGVIDACKVSEQECFRILVLSEGADGVGKLSLHAPWGASCDIALPSNLNMYNIFKITDSISPRVSREGSLKRVINEAPKALVALQHEDTHGRVDVVDSEGRRHRIRIQLQPSDSLVSNLIKVCEAVMPEPKVPRESVLCSWWSVVSWLRARSEAESNIEWTALVVVLFSIAACSIRKWHWEPVAHRKKRKSGLLRSSSGAISDLESWEAMLKEEATSTGAIPLWMQGTAWQWIAKQASTANSQPRNPSQNSKASKPSAFSAPASIPAFKKSTYIIHCVSLAREAACPSSSFAHGRAQIKPLPVASLQELESCGDIMANVLLGLHLFREELKLDITAAKAVHSVTPILAQLGGWLGWKSWGFKAPGYYAVEHVNMDNWLFDESSMEGESQIPDQPFEPPSILHYIEKAYAGLNSLPFISLYDVVSLRQGYPNPQTMSELLASRLAAITPRSLAIMKLFDSGCSVILDKDVTEMLSAGINLPILESLPESIAAPFRSSISHSQIQPSPTWESEVMEMIGREDFSMLGRNDTFGPTRTRPLFKTNNDNLRDVHAICVSAMEAENIGSNEGSIEVDRQSITRMIFNRDQRFTEAVRLVHPLRAPIARCTPEPGWSDTELLEAQQELVKIIALRTLSVSPGRGLVFYNARFPLLTEKFPIHGFTLSCVMKPTNTTITADRNTYSEEKVSWAFFHAGVEAGLTISKDAHGIDTSWILFNKPHELKNRHAGFLLALGLNGHLRSIAKWVAFKYLTPKHSMTSIGLLLGLSASYLGTMDTSVTRLLSVHVTRMLPFGAAELNLSPLTQTSGIMGIGLLYCNTQHRRMSEIMLSEIENVDQEENSNPLENLRDEGYRLAAGFALGYINLGRGKDLRGLHDMQIMERLLALATGPRKVSLGHILDKATAAATIAIALIFMKTQDAKMARKIDVPDTILQFDYVRPDVLLLRTVARHLIMWNEICPSAQWIQKQLPTAFQERYQMDARSLSSQDLPYLNIVAGICLSIGLRFAGTGICEARDILCQHLDHFMWICRLPISNYDRKLTRITARNCQDTIALATASVMAGTGDLSVFRRLRSLHGRTDVDTPYGSHLAAHLAIGVLFLGGGTHTFNTSNVAVASLLCAFYPLFPTTVLDNKSHLQAFRHFWVLATELRCLVVRDIDTHRPISLPVTVTLRDHDEVLLTAPCLLPSFELIAKITIDDRSYWRIMLNLIESAHRLEIFKRNQTIYVRQRSAHSDHTSVFSVSMRILNDAQLTRQAVRQAFEWVLLLPALMGLDQNEKEVALPAEQGGSIRRGFRDTVVDDRLALDACMESGQSERIWNLRLLFAWENVPGNRNGRWGWFNSEFGTELQAKMSLKLSAKGRMEVI